MPVQQIHPVKFIAILQAKLFHRVERLLLQLFRVATVTIMEHSTILVTTETGGVLQRTQQQMPGTGT